MKFDALSLLLLLMMMMMSISERKAGKIRDIGFAFNDKDFSDRILHLELVGDSSDSDSDSEPSDTQNSNKKQKIVVCAEKEDAVSSSNNSNGYTVVKVKTLHINTAILAASSPFFYKLFKNGMRESQEGNVTFRINASEDGAFMDLLNFIYTKTLSASSGPELLAVLMTADKFEVTSCISHCSNLLREKSMSLEFALLFVDIPSSVFVGEVVQSLIDEAKRYLFARYGCFIAFGMEEEAMELPLSAIEIILNSSNHVRSEGDVYKFILKWARARYPKLKERRRVLTKLVGRFVYFPYLGMSTLQEIRDSPESDSNQVTNLMLESLYLNSGYAYAEKRSHLRAASLGERFLERGYVDLPIKEVKLGQHHVVFLNLTSRVCRNLVEEGGRRCSQAFFVGQHMLKLWVVVDCLVTDERYLGLYVERLEQQEEGSSNVTCTFDYELEVLKTEEGARDIHKRVNCSLPLGRRVGSSNLLGVPWKRVLEGGIFFIDGILHLRAQIAVNNSHHRHLG